MSLATKTLPRSVQINLSGSSRVSSIHRIPMPYIVHESLTQFSLYRVSVDGMPIEKDDNDQAVMSYQVPYYHFRKWSRDGSLQWLFDASVISIKGELNLSELNLDGSHSAAKKGAKKSPIKGERRPRPAISCQ